MHELFQKRHSVRNFLNRAVDEEKLKEILAAADSAPSAGNLKAREIVVMRDEGIKQELAEAALGQEFVTLAPVILVFFALPEHSARKYGNRGRNFYALQDATIAASFAWLEAVALGLSACWVGAFDDEEVKDILKTKDDWRPIVIMPVGYAAE